MSMVRIEVQADPAMDYVDNRLRLLLLFGSSVALYFAAPHIGVFVNALFFGENSVFGIGPK